MAALEERDLNNMETGISGGRSGSIFASARSNHRLAPSVTISDCPSEVFCCRFSPDGKFLAAGCGDGAVRVFNAETGRQAYSLNTKKGADTLAGGLPTTGLRFRPITAMSKTKNVMLVANSDGSVGHWHMTSGKCLHTVATPDNQLYAVDYRPDGAMFATAGKDKKVRVYDEATKTLVSEMGGGYTESTSGHSNRVFSLKVRSSFAEPACCSAHPSMCLPSCCSSSCSCCSC